METNDALLRYAGQPDDAKARRFSILTINCWGLKWIAKDKNIRISALADTLAHWHSPLDAIVCQELWCLADFEYLRDALQTKLPFFHRFEGGCVGTGLAIFSAHCIQASLFLPFQPNGKYWKFHHADWYAAKGVGMARLRLDGNWSVNVLTTHTHVEKPGGEYRTHRVAQALSLADLVDSVSEAADLTVLAGDFNSRPTEELISLLQGVTDLKDAWNDAEVILNHPSLSLAEQKNVNEGPPLDRRLHSKAGIAIAEKAISGTREANYFSTQGGTCDMPCNSYAKGCDKPGSRLDYVLFSTCCHVTGKTVCCARPLPNRIPDKWARDCSYSDHEALVAVIEMRRSETALPLRRGNTVVESVAADAMRIAGTQLQQTIVQRTRAWKLSVAFGVVCLLVALGTVWLPWKNQHCFVYINVPANFLRVVLGGLVCMYGFVHPVITHAEVNALRRAWASLVLRTRGDPTLLSVAYLE